MCPTCAVCKFGADSVGDLTSGFARQWVANGQVVQLADLLAKSPRLFNHI